jgi:3-dehydroquinate dehydratase/shikimate dehydrogenase
MAELRQARDRVSGADLVELRLDTVRDPDVAAALHGRRTPVVVTCRAAWEGGSFRGSEEERHAILAAALAGGAEYVDIEWKAGFDDLLASTSGRRIVLSSHDFDGLPADLAGRGRAMRATGAEVVKIAAKVSCLRDCLPFLDLERATGHGRSVFIAMGDAGLVTRVLAARFGCAWTYAGALKDVGQFSVETLLSTYRFRSLSASSTLYGLVGSPIAHSVSPAMHNAALGAAGLDAVYLPLPANDVDDFLAFARAMGLAGASITIPFKVALAERVDRLDDTASRIGAINTIRVANGVWAGRNTDLAGFLQPLLDRGVVLKGTRASILGAGGAARAVAIALSVAGAPVTLHARDRERAATVAAATGASVGGWPPPAGSWDLLVNCTPVGMHPQVDATPIDPSLLTGRMVYDLVYNPLETRLLREAARAGCQTIGGLEMLVAQAVEQFEWWTGRRPSAPTMRAAAMERLSEFQYS